MTLCSRRSKQSSRYRDSNSRGFIDIGTATAADLCGCDGSMRIICDNPCIRAKPLSLLFKLSLAHGLRASVRDTNVIEQFSDEGKLFWKEE